MLVYFYERLSKYESKKNIPQISQLSVPAPRKKSTATVKDKTPVKKEVVARQVSENITIPVGLVVIKNIAGEVINQRPVPVVGDGWIALPKAFCLGGAEWIFKMGPDTEAAIVAGLYNEYDRIGLWRIPEGRIS